MPFCDECGEELKVSDKFCSNCGAPVSAKTIRTLKKPESVRTPKRPEGRLVRTEGDEIRVQSEIVVQSDHTGLGIASLILGLIAIVSFFVPVFIFGILATVFGAASYWGKKRDSFGLAGFILGLISIILNIIIWIVVIAIIASVPHYYFY